MKLIDLKLILDSLYGFDIATHTRKREYAYARKVFTQLAKNYGYEWKHMESVIEQPHDLLIYYYNTFHTVRPLDLEKYNICIESFNLNMEKIPSMSWYVNGKTVQSIVNKLKKLSRKDLKYFETSRVDQFIHQLKKEEEIESLHKKVTS